MTRVQIQLIKEAMDAPEKLSDWENEFIDSLAGKEGDYELSDKQASILNRINSKVI